MITIKVTEATAGAVRKVLDPMPAESGKSVIAVHAVVELDRGGALALLDAAEGVSVPAIPARIEVTR